MSAEGSGRVGDKVAIVTGGASGIGRGVSMRLAEEGAIVVIADVQEELGALAVSEIVDSGGKAQFLRHDVTNENQWVDLIVEVVQEHGGLHVLVNNAGIAIVASILEMSLEDWRRQQAVNLDGVFLGVKHAIPAMIESQAGSIINVSSVAGMKGAPLSTGYNATKGGVRIFTKGVALECASNRWPIRVNSVHPGIIDTPIWDTVAESFGAGLNKIDLDEVARHKVPTGELGTPLDIANAVLFLASNESRYITGTEVIIDGGLSA